MKNYYRALTALILLSPILCFPQSIEVEVLNGKTREIKKYSYGNNFFEIDIRFVKGWSKCIAAPQKIFEFYGSPKLRGELYCQTMSGETQSVSCVANKNDIDVTITSIFGGKLKFNDANNINTESYAELSLICSYR